MPPAKREDLTINTIIGPGTTVSGDLDAAGFVRVDGTMKGNLSAQGRVVVGEKARMKSDIAGTTVTVGGVVKGNILACDRVIVLATALVLGDIVTRRFQADEGCLINGKIVICGPAGDWDSKVAEYRDEQSVISTLSAPAESTNPKPQFDTERSDA